MPQYSSEVFKDIKYITRVFFQISHSHSLGNYSGNPANKSVTRAGGDYTGYEDRGREARVVTPTTIHRSDDRKDSSC